MLPINYHSLYSQGSQLMFIPNHQAPNKDSIGNAPLLEYKIGSGFPTTNFAPNKQVCEPNYIALKLIEQT